MVRIPEPETLAAMAAGFCFLVVGAMVVVGAGWILRL
jgi:hypothetical protein